MATHISNKPIDHQSRDNKQVSDQDEMKDYTSFWAFVAVIVMAILIYAAYTAYDEGYQSSPISQTMGSAPKTTPELAIVNP